jgi:hypothetical protein
MNPIRTTLTALTASFVLLLAACSQPAEPQAQPDPSVQPAAETTQQLPPSVVVYQQRIAELQAQIYALTQIIEQRNQEIARLTEQLATWQAANPGAGLKPVQYLLDQIAQIQAANQNDSLRLQALKSQQNQLTNELAALLERYKLRTPTANPSPTLLPGANGWYNTNLRVDWNWSDLDGDLDPANCTKSTLSNGQGQLTLSATCRDLAGNTGNASYTLRVDSSLPTVKVLATTADNSPYVAGTWTNQDVSFSFTCADALSGMAQCPSPLVLSVSGVKTIASDLATDRAGNSTKASFGPVQLDKIAPKISASATTADGKAYTAGVSTSQPVTVSFKCADNTGGSGVVTCPSPVVVSTSTPAVSGTVKDGAGNSASVSFGPMVIK